MLSEVAYLVQSGVNEKRKGNFRKAVKLYEQAIELEPSPNAIMYISLAKSQYLLGDRDGAIANYMRGFYYQLIENRNIIDINKLYDTRYQVNILQTFHNTILHLAHAYVDLDKNERSAFANELVKSFERQKESFLRENEVLNVLNYLSEQYAYDLASGGIKNQPYEPIDFAANKDIDWNGIYITKGINIAYSTIQWEKVVHLLINAE